jgi:hypothetical protein
MRLLFGASDSNLRMPVRTSVEAACANPVSWRLPAMTFASVDLESTNHFCCSICSSVRPCVHSMEPWTTARRDICEATSAVGAGVVTKGITPGRTSLRRQGSAAFDKMRVLTAGVFRAPRPAPLPEDSARLDDPRAPRPPASGCGTTAGLRLTGAGLAGLGSKSSQSRSSRSGNDGVRRGELRRG